jgi:CheY-like chemotaxis protein
LDAWSALGRHRLDPGAWEKGLQMTKTNVSRPRPIASSAEAGPWTSSLSTVLASVPGVAEQSLRATLESLASVEIVGTAAGCLSATQMVRDRQADLVVFDANLPFEDVQAFLQQLRQDGLATHTLVLAVTTGQVRAALDAGADAALRRDASIRQLSATVDRLRHTRSPEEPEPNGEILVGGLGT